jgi:hypothetical protein
MEIWNNNNIVRSEVLTAVWWKLPTSWRKSSNLKMEAAGSSNMLVPIYQTA